MNKKWKPSEDQFIRENAEKLTDEAACRQLSILACRHISPAAYRKRRQNLGVGKKSGRPKRPLMVGAPVPSIVVEKEETQSCT